jgi:hypothetical protein
LAEKGGTMLLRKTVCLLVVVFLLPILSCTRLDTPPEGEILGTEKLPALSSIPLDWGKLVSVTTIPIYQGMFQLWFQDESGKVRIVGYDERSRQLAPEAVVVPRK